MLQFEPPTRPPNRLKTFRFASSVRSQDSMRTLVFLLLVGCGGVVEAEPKPAPACMTELGAVDCTSSDCLQLHDVGGGVTEGTTIRGRCDLGDRCVVWPETTAVYGVCR